MATLKVITNDLTPAAEVKRRMRRHPKPAAMMSCPKCGGRSLIVETTGAVYEGGKVRGGTKAHLCAHCYMRGERIVLA